MDVADRRGPRELQGSPWGVGVGVTVPAAVEAAWYAVGGHL